MQKRFYRKAFIFIFLIMFLMAWPHPGLAIDNIEQLNNEITQQQVTRDSNIAVNIVKLIVILVIIIGLGWLVIKIFARQVNNRRQGNWLQVVDEIILGQNRGIIICKINHKVYALGVTDHQVNYLFSIDDPQFIEEIDQYQYQDFSTNQSLAEQLLNTGWLKNRVKFTSPKDDGSRGDFHSLMQEQLGKIKKMSDPNVAEKFANILRSDKNEEK